MDDRSNAREAAQLRRNARFYMARFYPLFEALVHDREGHAVKFRRARVVCVTCLADLGPDTPEQAENEFDRWIRERHV